MVSQVKAFILAVVLLWGLFWLCNFGTFYWFGTSEGIWLISNVDWRHRKRAARAHLVFHWGAHCGSWLTGFQGRWLCDTDFESYNMVLE